MRSTIFLVFYFHCWGTFAQTGLRPGDTIQLEGSDYVIDSHIGQGAFSEVYSVTNTQSGHKGAARIHKADLNGTSDHRTKVSRVAKMRKFYKHYLDQSLAQESNIPILFPETLGVATHHSDKEILNFAVEVYPLLEGSIVDLFVNQNLGPVKASALNTMFDQINTAIVYMNDPG
jgi:serine/threonine protein kinase